MNRDVVIGRSPPGGSARDCVASVVVAGKGSGSAQLVLDNSYVDSTVTVCVHYNTGECSSSTFTTTILGEWYS